MNCSACNKSILSNSAFCKWCGKKQEPRAAQPTTTTPALLQHNVIQHDQTVVVPNNNNTIRPFCPKCGNVMPIKQSICSYCSYDRKDASVQQRHVQQPCHHSTKQQAVVLPRRPAVICMYCGESCPIDTFYCAACGNSTR